MAVLGKNMMIYKESEYKGEELEKYGGKKGHLKREKYHFWKKGEGHKYLIFGQIFTPDI